MESRIQRWGNSLAVRIPKPLAVEIGLEDNSTVELSLENGKLVVAPVAHPGPSLTELLARVTTKNLHREVDAGPAQGDEAW